MSAIHVVPRPELARAQHRDHGPLYGLFDVVVDGVNITARIGTNQAIALHGEFAHAVAALISGERSRATLHLYTDQEAWELGLEADGSDALLSVYRAGISPDVAVHGRRVPLAELRETVLSALNERIRDARSDSLRATLSAARGILMAQAVGRTSTIKREAVEFGTSTQSLFSLRGLAEFRSVRSRDGRPEIEKSDLHSLLLLGTFRTKVRGRTVSVTGVQLFLIAEHLVALAEEALDAWQSARPAFRRVEVGELRIGIRRGPGDATLSFTLGKRSQQAGGPAVTFPELDTTAFAAVVAQFGILLADTFEQHDPGQRQNLRLGALRNAARELLAASDGANTDHRVLRETPHTRTVFSAPPRAVDSSGRWQHGGKMRFQPRWSAHIPGIELRSTAVYDGRFIASSQREMVCLDALSGELIWTVAASRAGSVPTSHGLARLHPDGKVCLHDFDTGLVRATLRLAPRVAGGATGAVVQSPGLPKLLVVAEGDRQITALDLVSGEIRWRYTAPCAGSYRVRRAGRLIIVAGGGTALSALDVASGELAWRVCDRLPFSGDMAVDRELVFAVSGTKHGPSKIHCFDLQCGTLRWSAALEDRPIAGQPVLATTDAVVIPTRNPRGIGAIAYARSTGQVLWRAQPGLTLGPTAWLATEERIILNSASGTVLGLDAMSGVPRFTHVFSQNVEADQPRRLELHLRDGALFVPQQEVVVLRPGDGEIIGKVPSGIIPDVLRVDERCTAYLVEENGDIAAFSSTAQLLRIK